jgi:hypothetical protein
MIATFDAAPVAKFPFLVWCCKRLIYKGLPQCPSAPVPQCPSPYYISSGALWQT